VAQDRVEWQSRSHFFAVAARVMRRILTDYARARASAKRGGSAVRVPLDAPEADHAPALVRAERITELLTLNDALDRLAAFNPRGAAVVEYRVFGGMSHPEIAEVLGISEVTVRRAWAMAKAWLWRQLE
jgi:RNA polymerase sigma factor (TIGR02999 family)